MAWDGSENRDALVRSQDSPSLESVFAYDDPIDYLNFELRRMRRENRKFSLRAWARDLGYENPSYLAQVLNRDRKLKPDLAAKIALSLRLGVRQKKYFELLVLGHASAKEKMTRQFRPLKTKRSAKSNAISLEIFTLISEWYHYVIIEMPQLADFESREEYIQKRLGRSVDKRTVRAAIERLLRLGFIVKNDEGIISRGSLGNHAYDPGVSTQAVRALHRTLAEMGRRAVEEQSVETRDFFGSTLSFRLEDMPKVRDIVRQAHLQVLSLEAATNGDEIYQFNTQFFSLTTPLKPSKERKKTK